MKKQLLVGAFVVIGSLTMATGVASAGEITGPVGKGNGAKPEFKFTPINPDGEEGGPSAAGSICAFSGLNDEYVRGDTGAPKIQSPAEVAGLHITGFACRGFASLPEA